MVFIFGITTLLVWAFNDDHRSIILYFLYTAGYSGVILFQVSIHFAVYLSWEIAQNIHSSDFGTSSIESSP